MYVNPGIRFGVIFGFANWVATEEIWILSLIISVLWLRKCRNYKYEKL